MQKRNIYANRSVLDNLGKTHSGKRQHKLKQQKVYQSNVGIALKITLFCVESTLLNRFNYVGDIGRYLLHTAY